MAWIVTDDLGVFLGAAGGLLAARPVENTVALSLTETLRAAGPTAYGQPGLFGWWRPATGGPTAAFVVTPPRPLLLVDVPPEAIGPLAVTLRRLGRPIAGVAAEAGPAGQFARAWVALTGGVFRVVREDRLYRLGTLTPPDPPPPGAARVATDGDRERLLAWLAAFARDIGEEAGRPPSAVFEHRLAAGDYTLWVVDGQPVALASTTRPVAGMVRIGSVYTPGAGRRRGFGAAVTAAAARRALAAGATDVLLFADLANPTSNGVYRRLGFGPVVDRTVVAFEAGNPGPAGPVNVSL